MDESSLLKQYIDNDRIPFKDLLDKHSDAIYIINNQGIIMAANYGFSFITGYQESDIIGKHIVKFMHEKDVEQVKFYFQEAISGKLKKRYFRIVDKTDNTKTVSVDALPIVIDGRNVGLFIIGKDITEWIEELNHKDKRFEALIKNSTDIISIMNNKGEITYFSDSIERILGYRAEELTGDPFQLMHPDDHARIEKAIYKIISKEINYIIEVELRLQHRNGEWLNFQVIATNLLDDPDVHGIVINYRDITSLKVAQEKLHYSAYHDYLTGLPNRRLFEEKMQEQIAKAEAEQNRFAVFFIDLDNFKSINDTLGHDSGDELLKKVAVILNDVVGDKGLASRWGGDEFFVLLNSIEDDDKIQAIANNIKKKLSVKFTMNQYEVFITGSIGVSIYPDSGDDLKSLLKTADLALYLTKSNGKNDFQIFTQEMMANAAKTFQLQRDLYKALANDEFILFYQPRINAKSGKICAVEALIRWIHPKFGLIPPNDFIYLAEETGLIVQIGDWVYQEACRQIRRWKEAGKDLIKVSVNFSTLQFLEKDLIQRMESFLKESDIEGRWIEVEITESVLVQNDQELIKKLEAIKQLGVQVVLDDFGKGYSSIDYLRKFRFHSIKLDRSFIYDIHENEDSAAIAKFMVLLGKQLKTNIVAEGVELIEQLEALKKLDCDEFQGYLFSKPVPIAELESII